MSPETLDPCRLAQVTSALGAAWSLCAHLARRALAQSWSVGSKRWTGSAVTLPGGSRSAVVPVNLKAPGLSKAPHLGQPKSPSSPSDEAPPRKGRNVQTSPWWDTVALRGLSQPAEVRGRPGFCTLGDRGSPPGSWSLTLPQHSPTSLSLVLAYPGGADSLGAPSLLSTLLTCWPDPGPTTGQEPLPG